MRRNVCLAVAVAVFCVARCSAGTAAVAQDADAILKTAGVQGGLIVHLGCGDARLTAALGARRGYLVHGLDADPASAEQARTHIRSLGLYGRVSVEQFAGSVLPYVDNMVDLVVVEKPGDVSMGEVMRVLAPGGVACVKAGNAWTGAVLKKKPRPADIDEWTHFLHDASGNAVAKDSQVGPPRHLQWIAGPKRARDHDALASMSALTSSGGRIFTILDEGPISLIHRPAQWRLIARDALNGVLLWKREIPTWLTHLYYFRCGPVQLPRRLVSIKDRVYVTLGLAAPVTALDAATGETLLTYEGSEGTEEIVCDDDVLLAVVGDPDLFNHEADKVYGYWELSVNKSPEVAKSIVAYRASTGQRLWTQSQDHLKYLAPLSLCASAGKAFYMDNQGLYCVDLMTGREIWQAACPTEGLFLRSYAPTVVVSGDVVLCLTLKQLAAFSVQDGRKLWQHKGYLGFASPGSLLVAGGLAWTIPETASIWNGNKTAPDGKIITGIPVARDNLIGNGGSEIWGIDIHSGTVVRSLRESDVLTSGHHHRCYRDKATERYLICGRRGVEFVDLAGDQHVHNWWIRGECQYGVMPSNGLLYRPPDPCACFNLVKVDGFCALCCRSSLDADVKAADHERLVTGPAYGRIPPLEPPLRREPAGGGATESLAWQPPIYGTEPEDWPTYRHDVTRSGSTPSHIPASLKTLWEAKVGEKLSSGVVAGGKLFVSDVDRQTLHCLDAQTGKPLWQFTAAGRIDSPPTIVESGKGKAERGQLSAFPSPSSLCLFGSCDGWAYCLRASDGKLVWRFRGAIVDKRIAADDRLESVWPIHGSVLVLRGVAYFAAGRSSYLDGGIRLYGLDVRSGRQQCEASLVALADEPGRALQEEPQGAMTGALSDVLVSDGQTINMRHVQFDLDLLQRPVAELKTLLTTTGFLEDCWAHRLNWELGHPGKINSQQHAGGIRDTRYDSRCPFGKLLVFDAQYAYGVQNPYTVLKHTAAMWPPTHEGHLHQKYARYTPGYFPIGVRMYARPNSAVAQVSGKEKRRGSKQATDAPPVGGDAWAVDPPLQVRAMVLADDALFVAGWLDSVAFRQETGAPLDESSKDEGQAVLWALSPADGSILAQYKLSASPAWDGMFAARGKLYLSLKNGTVLCMGGG